MTENKGKNSLKELMSDGFSWNYGLLQRLAFLKVVITTICYLETTNVLSMFLLKVFGTSETSAY